MNREKTEIPLERRLGLVKRRIAINQRIQKLMDLQRQKSDWVLPRIVPAKD